MQLQLLRNAALKLVYAGRTLLIDPDLAPKHARESFTGRSPNPMVDLPSGVEAILDGVELVIVSHLHEDHFDDVAKASLPKRLPLICQPGDEEAIRAAGFTDVRPLVASLDWNGIGLTRREGSHGVGPVLELMGSVKGFSLKAAGEPSLYWAGDSVFYPAVAETIRSTAPDIVVTHSCGARWDGDLIVMDEGQTLAVCDAVPDGIVVAVHMEALDHATVPRRALRRAAEARGISEARLLIPADGEILSFGAR